LQNDGYGVSTESGSDRVTILAISILAISGDPVATAPGTDLILKLRHHLFLRQVTFRSFGTIAVLQSNHLGKE